MCVCTQTAFSFNESIFEFRGIPAKNAKNQNIWSPKNAMAMHTSLWFISLIPVHPNEAEEKAKNKSEIANVTTQPDSASNGIKDITRLLCFSLSNILKCKWRPEN